MDQLPSQIADFTPVDGHWLPLQPLIEAAFVNRDPRPCYAALFYLFGRYPREDGAGIFSSAMHRMVATGGYETTLIQAHLQHPSSITKAMLQRMINSGITDHNGFALAPLLLPPRQQSFAVLPAGPPITSTTEAADAPTPRKSRIRLHLSGDFDPQEVAAHIPLQPDRCKAKFSNPSGLTPVTSILEYGTVETAAISPDIWALSNISLEMLEPHTEAIAAVVKAYRPYVSLSVLLHFPVNGDVSTPSLVFSHRLITFLAATGALIDIDTYRVDGNGQICD